MSIAAMLTKNNKSYAVNGYIGRKKRLTRRGRRPVQAIPGKKRRGFDGRGGFG